MNANIRMTQTTLLVLQALVQNSGRELSGSEIAKQTRLMSGTIYPILHRLEKNGWLKSVIEKVDPSIVKRPRRRYYSLTGEANLVASEKVAERFHGLLSPNSSVGELNA